MRWEREVKIIFQYTHRYIMAEKLAYLTEIFTHINLLNKSLQDGLLLCLILWTGFVHFYEIIALGN